MMFRKDPRLILYRAKPFSLLFRLLITLAMAATVAFLFAVVGYIVVNGIAHLSPELVFGEYSAENPSMGFAIYTTVLLVVLALLISAPFGIASAIYLAEYAQKGSRIVKWIRLATETLAGIPSIIYGLFGALLFGKVLGLGYSLLSGVLTVAIMILPLMIRSTEEALQSVPDSYREGSFALGAGKLRTLFRIILPAAQPGILAAVSLSIGRIIGETAVLLFTLGTDAQRPQSLLDSSRTLAIHMYINTRDGGMAGRQTAFAVGVVLIVLVIGLNLLATFLLQRMQGREQGNG